MDEITEPDMEVHAEDDEPGETRAVAVPTGQAGGALARMSDAEFNRALEGMARALARTEQIQRSLMRKGVDYDIIPGTNKPALLKPGTELLNTMMGYDVACSAVRTVTNVGMILYTAHCTVSDPRSGRTWTASGTANSHEVRYRYRKAERTCPECGEPAVIKGRAEYGGGWLCYRKKGGCGAKWPDGTKEIEEQTAGRVENEDPADLDNTLIKMAEKRAIVAATLIAHNASRLFTQDIADSPSPKPPPAEPDEERRRQVVHPPGQPSLEQAMQQFEALMDDSEQDWPTWLNTPINLGKMKAKGYLWKDGIGDTDIAVEIRKWMHTCLSMQAKDLEEKNLEASVMANYKPWHIQCRIVLLLHAHKSGTKADTGA